MIKIKVDLKAEGRVLYAFINGEIDHHTSKEIRDKIDSEIESINPASLVIDLGDVSFMDSSGVGIILGRYKLMRSIGGKIQIKSPKKEIKRILSLSGVERLVDID